MVEICKITFWSKSLSTWINFFYDSFREKQVCCCHFL